MSTRVAGRPKDLEFGRALLDRGIVEPTQLVGRLEHVDVEEPVRARIAGRIAAWSVA